MNRWAPWEIAYCANVHPGTTATAIEHNLSAVTRQVRQRLNLEQMAAGLWLCESALLDYQPEEARARLKHRLAAEGLTALTCNGFPQRDFHQPVVKASVYQPNWADPERLDYTLHLARVLADLLPADVQEGTISTLPLGYRLDWDAARHTRACEQLLAYAASARNLESATGKRIRLCLEMEPGCVLERTAQALELFASLSEQTRSKGLGDELVRDYLGLCFDICHQAVMQEDIATSVAQISDAGICIGKIQVSSAVQVDNASQAAVREALAAFAEPKYLHQTTVRCADGRMLFFDDLHQALASPEARAEDRWYVHFHVPIQSRSLDLGVQGSQGLSTTQPAIVELLQQLPALANKPHLEVETYTWHVLPGRSEQDDWLIRGLGDECAWLQRALNAAGLLEGASDPEDGTPAGTMQVS